MLTCKQHCMNQRSSTVVTGNLFFFETRVINTLKCQTFVLFNGRECNKIIELVKKMYAHHFYERLIT